MRKQKLTHSFKLHHITMAQNPVVMNEIKILYLLHRHLDIHMPNTADTLNNYGNMMENVCL